MRNSTLFVQRGHLFCFILFFVLGMILVWPSLHYPMVWDDLHLIREYSPQELRSTWSDNWDPSNTETAGFRPLSTYFNGLRYALFGENVALHRVFLITLFALFLTLMVWIAEIYGLSRDIGILAMSLVYASKYNSFHYVWIADGIHLFQALFFAVSLLALLQGLRTINSSQREKGQQNSNHYTKLVWKGLLILLFSIALAGLGLLVREDSLNFVLTLPLLGAYYSRNHFSLSAKTSYTALRNSLLPHLFYSFTLVSMIAAWWTYRATIVDESTLSTLTISGWIQHFHLSFLPHGLTSFDLLSKGFIVGWFCFLLFLSIYAVIKKIYWPGSMLFWLICTFVAASSGIVAARNNLLLIPITFAMLALGAFIDSIKQPDQTLIRYALVASLLGAIYISWTASQTYHPFSIETIAVNSRTIYAPESSSLAIPDERRLAIQAQLALVGINGPADIERIPELAEAAIKAGRYTPAGIGEPFVSRLPSLYVP